MKRSDVKLKVGDSVRVKTGRPHNESVAGTVAALLGRKVKIDFSDGSHAWFFSDGGAVYGRAIVCEIGGVIREDEPRALAYDASLDKVRTSLFVAKEGALKVATLTDKMTAALRQFCARVESGEIRSVKTYAQFKQLLAEYEALS